MNKGSKVGKIIISVLLWIIILIAALFAFVTLATKDANNVASIGGVTPMTVQSDSMSPTFEKGDLIFVRKVDTDKLEVGDIVTFHTIIEDQYVLNTHRIVAIDEHDGYREFTTQGDNNQGIQDEHKIIGGDIVGQYFMKLKGFGKVIDFLSSKIGFLVIIVLPLLLFFIYQVYHLIMISTELKKANAIEAAIQSEEIKQQMTESTSKDADDAEKMQEEAAKALEEAKRLKAEAEAALAKAKEINEKK